jgi:hypothetical protein
MRFTQQQASYVVLACMLAPGARPCPHVHTWACNMCPRHGNGHVRAAALRRSWRSWRCGFVSCTHCTRRCGRHVLRLRLTPSCGPQRHSAGVHSATGASAPRRRRRSAAACAAAGWHGAVSASVPGRSPAPPARSASRERGKRSAAAVGGCVCPRVLRWRWRRRLLAPRASAAAEALFRRCTAGAHRRTTALHTQRAVLQSCAQDRLPGRVRHTRKRLVQRAGGV